VRAIQDNGASMSAARVVTRPSVVVQHADRLDQHVDDAHRRSEVGRAALLVLEPREASAGRRALRPPSSSSEYVSSSFGADQRLLEMR
jgi:hypothetical protein